MHKTIIKNYFHCTDFQYNFQPYHISLMDGEIEKRKSWNNERSYRTIQFKQFYSLGRRPLCLSFYFVHFWFELMPEAFTLGGKKLSPLILPLFPSPSSLFLARSLAHSQINIHSLESNGISKFKYLCMLRMADSFSFTKSFQALLYCIGLNI